MNSGVPKKYHGGTLRIPGGTKLRPGGFFHCMPLIFFFFLSKAAPHVFRSPKLRQGLKIFGLATALTALPASCYWTLVAPSLSPRWIQSTAGEDNSASASA